MTAIILLMEKSIEDEDHEYIRWLKTVAPADIRDAAVVGFELSRIDAAARAGLSMIDTTPDEIRRKRRDTLVRMKLHADQGAVGDDVMKLVNCAVDTMVARRRAP